MRRGGSGDATPGIRFVVGVERLLLRPEIGRNVLEVDAYPRPRPEPTPHGIEEDVGRLQVSAGVGVADLPPFEAGQRVSLPTCAPDLYQRSRWCAPP